MIKGHIDIRESIAPLRCLGCGALLARIVTAPFRIECRRCGRVAEAGVDEIVAKTYTMGAAK